ncbi:hypothetical protein [Streptomyces profundus]|nr:hypothetical protein [Streptomyces sp. MA3_2.13]
MSDTHTPNPATRPRGLLAKALRLLALAAVSGAVEGVVSWLLR